MKAIILLFLFVVFPVAAQQERKITINDRELTIPDLTLVDQDGKSVRFYTDCTYICTRQGELISSLQKELGPRLGKDGFIISVTMNPQTDTSAKLKSWSRKYGRKPGWTLVTGSPVEVEKLLRLFTGERVGPKEVHSGIVYIADDRTGRWSLIDDLTPGAEVERRMDELKQSPIRP